MDFILNGKAHGSVASALLESNMDPRVLRPYSIDGRGTYITVTNKSTGKEQPELISNATATMRKDEWILLDKAIVAAAKPRLRAVTEIRKRGLTFTLDGMAKTVLQTQTQSDITPAEMAMNPVRESQNDRPEYELGSIPLPVIYKDFSIFLRELNVSRNGGSPLDTSNATLASRRVAELCEQLLIGTYGSYKYAGGYIYGIINFPDAQSQVLTNPTDSAWTPATTVREVLAMKQKSQDAFHYGPWILFNAPAWDEHLDDDYSDAKGDNTLRERIAKIKDIVDVVTLDYMTGYRMSLVQLTEDVIREIIGMEITTLQWESKGGLELHFKVMTIQVPQLRSDINGNSGVINGNVA